MKEGKRKQSQLIPPAPRLAPRPARQHIIQVRAIISGRTILVVVRLGLGAALAVEARCAHERCATEVLAALEHAVGEIACAA